MARFVQPDTIVPNPGYPQSLNRYSYTLTNPLKYTDPTGHDPACATLMGCGPLEGIAALVCEVGSAITAFWPQIQALAVQAQQLAPFAAELPAAKDGYLNPQPASPSSNAGNPVDPVGRVFKDAAERYQYQTSGTRFGEEVRLNVRVGEADRTIDVDGIVNEYLHESKFIDYTSGFYSKQIGSLATGLTLHVSKWADDLQCLAAAAEQHGYNGVKVFVNEAQVIPLAQELFGTQEWFRLIGFIYQTPK